MPGAIQAMTHQVAIGWARHPVRHDYPVLVHVSLGIMLIHSVLADQPASDAGEVPDPHWFTIDLARLKLAPADTRRLVFSIGETDEVLPVLGRPARAAAADGVARLEDILALNAGRSWVSGATWHDAVAAGVSAEDILDLLYRDLLGRSADLPGLTSYLYRLRTNDTTYDGIRKSLVESEEYAQRRIQAARAPGAIFSQRIALCSATRYGGARMPRGPAPRRVALAPLLRLDADRFVTVLYRDVLRRPAPGKLARRALLDRLSAGATRQSVLSEIIDTARRTGVPGEVDALEIIGLDPTAPSGTVDVPASSPMFSTGWYDPEPGPGGPHRWMAEAGVIGNPHPAWSVHALVLRITNVYGADAPLLRCTADDVELPMRWEGRQGGFVVHLEPFAPINFHLLRVVAEASGCPLKEGKGTDHRVISLYVAGAAFTYGEA